jgi:1-deoxy-D-xylulose-5-phosphate reductoisomerase
MKRVTVLGSTGSIGRSALDVIAGRRDLFKVVGLTAHRNIDLLVRQVEEFGPEVVAVSDGEAAMGLKGKVSVPVLHGEEGLCRVASLEGADFVLSAIVGFAGLMPTLAAVRAGKTIGLANKETLVVAGDIVAGEAERTGARILPVDSEHSAVFQCIEGRDRGQLRKVVLTASGGPFIGKRADELSRVTPADALNHPNWAMGKKITVDSATLMNKGLEVIEAHHLFGLGPESIEVLIHPQSIVHCVVEFTDGSAMAHLSVPDMRAAIAYALSYPERLGDVVRPLDLSSVGRLTFQKPDLESFPCLSYAYQALREGGTAPAVLNGANEIAVGAFLEGRIGFTDIPAIIRDVMGSHERGEARVIEAVLEADRWARQRAVGLIASLTAG